MERWFLRIIWVLVFLSSVVYFEPAPYDVLFVFVFLVSLFLLKPMPRFGRVEIFCAGFLITNLISISFAPSMGRALWYFAVTLYLIVSWVIFSALLERFGQKMLNVIFSAYTTTAVLAALLGSFSLLGLFPDNERFVWAGVRAVGLFKDPNVYGSFLVPVAVCCLYRICVGEKRDKIIWSSLSAAVFLGVLLSFSRGAWLNYVFSLGVFAVVFCTVNLRKTVTAGLIVLFCVILITGYVYYHPVVGPLFLDRLGVRTDGGITDGGITDGGITDGGVIDGGITDGGITDGGITDGGITDGGVIDGGIQFGLQVYDSDRFAFQRLALQTAMQKPLGIGPGQSEVVFEHATHNVFLRVLVENGWLGFLFFLAIIIELGVKSLRSIYRNDHFQHLNILIFAILLGTLLNSFFIDSLHWRHFWLLMALPSFGAVSNANRFTRNTNIA